MKTVFTIFGTSIFFLYLMFNSNNTVQAQSLDAEKAYQDYQFQQSMYQSSYSEYKDAVTFYKSQATLQLKEDARQKTLKMLKDRDQLIVVYLTALRTKFAETKGFNDTDKSSVFSKIDPEIEWYKNHITTYLNGDDLPTLFTRSAESKSRYKDSTTVIIYEITFDISLSTEIWFRIDHTSIYSDLTKHITDQVTAGKLRIDPFNRWFSDTDNVLQSLQSNESAAQVKLQLIFSQPYSMNSNYQEAMSILNTSVIQIKQLNNYLLEMIATIQNQ
jgi:hypothetical protein